MFVTQVDVLPTTLASTTWLTIRESSTYNRVLCFKNLTDNILSIKVQESADGGTTWTDHVTTFTLETGLVIVKAITSTGLLRVVGSGATNADGVLITYGRAFLDSQHIWQAPVV